MRRLSVVGLCVASFFTSICMAQPRGADGDDFLYHVVAGDTLSDIAERYTSGSNNWRLLQQKNQVDDTLALPIGKLLKIPFAMIPVSDDKATIQHVKGNATINGNLAHANEPIHAGDTIITSDNGFLTVQLSDHSTISIPPNSTVLVQQLNRFTKAPLTDSILKLEAGSVESRVAPDARGVGRFEVHTPTAVTGVRGTTLRVHHQTNTDHSITEVVSGQAHLHTRNNTQHTLGIQHAAVTNPTGQVVATTRLLPAPLLEQADPDRTRSPLIIHPVTGAQQYLVQVSLDREGANIVSREWIDVSPYPLRSYANGPHYVWVRAVDEYGVMGDDAQLHYTGLLGVISRNGQGVLTDYGLPLALTQY